MLIDKNTELSEVYKIIFDTFHEAAKDPSHPFRFLSLATANQEGPDMRYVVLRAIDEEGRFYFFTDYRTQKINHIKTNPQISLLFYDSEKRIQIRMKATASIHRNNDEAEKYWKTVDGDARKAYNPLIVSGTQISHPEEAYKWPQEMEYTNFTVVQVIPYELDVLQLDGLKHIRAKFIKNGGGNWKMDWVAP